MDEGVTIKLAVDLIDAALRMARHQIADEADLAAADLEEKGDKHGAYWLRLFAGAQRRIAAGEVPPGASGLGEEPGESEPSR